MNVYVRFIIVFIHYLIKVRKWKKPKEFGEATWEFEIG